MQPAGDASDRLMLRLRFLKNKLLDRDYTAASTG